VRLALDDPKLSLDEGQDGDDKLERRRLVVIEGKLKRNHLYCVTKCSIEQSTNGGPGVVGWNGLENLTILAVIATNQAPRWQSRATPPRG
jgi:hypothetical protein